MTKDSIGNDPFHEFGDCVDECDGSVFQGIEGFGCRVNYGVFPGGGNVCVGIDVVEVSGESVSSARAQAP